MSRFPHWPYVEDFSRINAPTGDGRCSVFSKDDMACFDWFPPESVMNTPEGFTSGGLLTVGASPCGDMLVIDTRAARDLEFGFVSHELLSEKEDSEADPEAVRAAYSAWPESLIEYLGHIHEDPEYSH